jgi:hypothetical protein
MVIKDETYSVTKSPILPYFVLDYSEKIQIANVYLLVFATRKPTALNTTEERLSTQLTPFTYVEPISAPVFLVKPILSLLLSWFPSINNILDFIAR